MCKLSIITVNKNNAEGLRKTIESIINQKYIDFEYIVIDGNSNDNSISIIKEHLDNIDFWISEPDAGIYNAMNKGVGKAKGEYILFLNSGDCFADAQVLFDVFSLNPIEDFIIGRSVMIGEKIKIKTLFSVKNTFHNLFYTTIHHQATFAKRSVFEEIGLFDESFTLAADFKVFITSVVIYGKTYKAIENTVAIVEPGGISAGCQTVNKIKSEKNRILKECFPYFYDDYIELHRITRFRRIKQYLIWRFDLLFQSRKK